jgi:hypothetical protein
MSTVYLGSLPLGAVNVGLDGAVTLVGPLLAQVDLMVTGPFGLGSLIADLQAQLQAALSAQVTFSLQIVDPIAYLRTLLASVLQVQASISAALSLGLPILPPLGVSFSLGGALSLRIGGINALIQAVLAVKLPIVNLFAGFNLSAGPIVLLSVGYASVSTLASSVVEYGALVSGGIGGILPFDPVFGVIMLTKDPSASLALAGIIKTS